MKFINLAGSCFFVIAMLMLIELFHIPDTNIPSGADMADAVQEMKRSVDILRICGFLQFLLLVTAGIALMQYKDKWR